MTDFFIQFALSNLLVSGVLALGAYAVHRRGRYPVLAHLLWVLVLAKLVTPPLLALPIAAFPGSSAQAGGVAVGGVAGSAAAAEIAVVIDRALPVLLFVWALGGLVVLVASLWRIYRFDRLLRTTSRTASADIQQLAAGLMRPLGLRNVPTIYLSDTRLSPLTWWTGGHVRIVIPAALPHQIDIDDLRMVLAHELAHVKRRDYLVRWLEWLANVAFWWNPIVWWARRNLHEDEEASCDALVLERLGVQPRSYANALVAVVAFLSGHVTRPPAVATGIDGRGSLEQRLVLIVGRGRIRTAPRWLAAGAVSAALVLMPLGIGSATQVEVLSEQPDPALGAISSSGSPSTDSAPRGTSSDDRDTSAGPLAGSDGFAPISANLSDAAVIALADSRDTRATRRSIKAKRSAKRAVKKALIAGLEARSTGNPSDRRSARQAIAKASARLDRTVAQGILSRGATRAVLKSLRRLYKGSSASGLEAQLDEAVANGLVSAKSAAILLATN